MQGLQISQIETTSPKSVISQGDTVEQARDNLKEVLELFFETSSPEEIKQRLHGDIFVTQVEVAVG